MKKSLLILMMGFLMSPILIAGNALNFDGDNDNVVVGNVAVLNFERTDAFTFECWLNLSSSMSGYGTLVSKSDEMGENQGWFFQTNDGKISLYLYHDGFPTSEYLYVEGFTDLRDNTWHHIALSYDGSSDANGVKMYIDGNTELFNIEYNSLSTLSIQSPADVEIGGNWGYDEMTIGTMDELRIWNDVRTQIEIQANKDAVVAPTSPNLVAYYRFDEGVANSNNAGITTLPDLTSNGNDGTLQNFALIGNTSNWVDGYLQDPSVPLSSKPLIAVVIFIILFTFYKTLIFKK